MNIVGERPVGTAFLHSQNASAEKHYANYIYKFVDRAIQDTSQKI